MREWARQEKAGRKTAGRGPGEGTRTAILSLGTAVPPLRMEQGAMARRMAEGMGAEPAVARWLARLYERSGIAFRHTCIPERDHPRFLPGGNASHAPTTAERMAIYEGESVVLAAEAGRKALADFTDPAGERGPSSGRPNPVAGQVTHLIAVSCTGFFAPGIDAALARALHLPPNVQRTVIGFMGCAAAFNALRLARSIVSGQPSALVLIVCVELCTIHLQPTAEREQLIAASLFADGAAACLVGKAGVERGDALEVQDFYTHLQPEHASEMSWSIGDHGFVMQLSAKIPELVSGAAPVGLRALWGDGGQPAFWAVHPGGRSILDRIADTFHLGSDEMEPSRSILHNYGNLSSPTILFVLDALRGQLRRRAGGIAAGADGDEACTEGVAMGFGPGLVTEMARLSYRPSPLTAGRDPGGEPDEERPAGVAPARFERTM